MRISVSEVKQAMWAAQQAYAMGCPKLANAFLREYPSIILLTVSAMSAKEA